jgi:hypothetical protein
MSVILLHHRNKFRAGRQRSALLEVGRPSLFDSGHLGGHSLDGAGIMKLIEALHGRHLLRRLQVLEDPAGGDHVVQIHAWSHDQSCYQCVGVKVT